MAKHPLNQSGLFKIIQEAQQYQALKEHIFSVLPENMHPYISAVGIEHPYLVLIINEALWASKIRFLAPSCLRHVNEIYPGLNLVSPVRVRLSQHQEPAPSEHKTHSINTLPDQATAKKMLALSEQVKSTTLSQALKRLGLRAFNGTKPKL